jgi:hypothetical protein
VRRSIALGLACVVGVGLAALAPAAASEAREPFLEMYAAKEIGDVGAAQAAATFADATGDAPAGADIRAVTVDDDSNGTIGIAVGYANRTCAQGADLVFVELDTDRSPATGGLGRGIDVVLFANGFSDTRGLARWDGSSFAVVTTTLQATCDSRAFDVWRVNRSEIGVRTAFNLGVSTYTDAAGTQRGDVAPDSLPLWSYQLGGSTPPPAPPPPAPPSPPPSPPSPPRPSPRTIEDAPRLPKRERYVGGSIRHAKVTRTIYSTMKLLGLQKQLNVACWSTPDWQTVVADLGGVASTPTMVLLGFWTPELKRYLHLSPRTCRDLQALISKRRGNVPRARASVVALHETVHMYGVGNEAAANCYATQLVYFFARELRITHTEALRLERLAVRSTRKTAPPGYWNPRNCRDGGAWDLDEDILNLDY